MIKFQRKKNVDVEKNAFCARSEHRLFCYLVFNFFSLYFYFCIHILDQFFSLLSIYLIITIDLLMLFCKPLLQKKRKENNCEHFTWGTNLDYICDFFFSNVRYQILFIHRTNAYRIKSHKRKPVQTEAHMDKILHKHKPT